MPLIAVLKARAAKKEAGGRDFELLLFNRVKGSTPEEELKMLLKPKTPAEKLKAEGADNMLQPMLALSRWAETHLFKTTSAEFNRLVDMYNEKLRLCAVEKLQLDPAHFGNYGGMGDTQLATYKEHAVALLKKAQRESAEVAASDLVETSVRAMPPRHRAHNFLTRQHTQKLSYARLDESQAEGDAALEATPALETEPTSKLDVTFQLRRELGSSLRKVMKVAPALEDTIFTALAFRLT